MGPKNATIMCTVLRSLITVLCLLGDFDQQVKHMLQYEMLPASVLKNLSQVVVDVETSLQTRWPGSKAFPIGSVVTGLATRSSDVDVYVAIPGQTDAPDAGIVIESEHEFRKQPALFIDFKPKPVARVPIITFIHVPTGRYCDVSFSSPSAVQNSQLIAYYLKLDKRVLNMAALLKLWGRTHGITSSQDLSNYALSLMLVFYLQQRSLVPPIARLQANSTHIENNWNTNFDPIIYTSMNNESLYELVGGFFKYYSKFDFEEYIISPYAGRKINRTLFGTVDDVPQDFPLYKFMVGNNITSPLESGIVIIQDPFDHNQNIGRCISQSLMLRLRSLFTFAAEMYDEVSSDKFLGGLLEMDEQKVMEICNIILQ